MARETDGESLEGLFLVLIKPHTIILITTRRIISSFPVDWQLYNALFVAGALTLIDYIAEEGLDLPL